MPQAKCRLSSIHIMRAANSAAVAVVDVFDCHRARKAIDLHRLRSGSEQQQRSRDVTRSVPGWLLAPGNKRSTAKLWASIVNRLQSVNGELGLRDLKKDVSSVEHCFPLAPKPGTWFRTLLSPESRTRSRCQLSYRHVPRCSWLKGASGQAFRGGTQRPRGPAVCCCSTRT
jgi:hypothetical protein